MKHLNEEELIEHHYGEGDADAKHHLEVCGQCAEAYAALGHDLAELNAAEPPARTSLYGEQVWRSLSNSLPCRELLKEYGEIDAELRRVASLESPAEARARTWETRPRTASSWWEKGHELLPTSIWSGHLNCNARLLAPLPLITWLYASIFVGLFLFLLWVGRHHALLTAILLQARGRNEITGITMLPLILTIVVFVTVLLPRFFLKRMIKDRQRRIRIALPDALDLTVICIEAGLALDQALMRVGQDLHHAHPDLSDEFHLVNLEMRAGKPRAEALRNMVDRTGVDDIRSLVGTLIQTDRFGTSIAQALRVHSDSLRTARRQRAEEQAAKTTIKVIPPLVVFVLVPFLFVTIGPTLIQAYHSLKGK